MGRSGGSDKTRPRTTTTIGPATKMCSTCDGVGRRRESPVVRADPSARCCADPSAITPERGRPTDQHNRCAISQKTRRCLHGRSMHYTELNIPLPSPPSLHPPLRSTKKVDAPPPSLLVLLLLLTTMMMRAVLHCRCSCRDACSTYCAYATRMLLARVEPSSSSASR